MLATDVVKMLGRSCSASAVLTLHAGGFINTLSCCARGSRCGSRGSQYESPCRHTHRHAEAENVDGFNRPGAGFEYCCVTVAEATGRARRGDICEQSGTSS
jgi:hypothetical protein